MSISKWNNMGLGKKYFWAFFSVVISIDLLLTATLLTYYCNLQINRTTEFSVAQLRQVCISTDILYESVEAVVNQIQTDADTSMFLYSAKTDRLQEAKVSRKLKSIRAANPYVRFVTLYNDTSKRFVSCTFAGQEELLNSGNYYNRLGDQPYVCYFREVGKYYSTQTSNTDMAYTFVFPLRLKPNSSADLVIIDVDSRYFDKAISNIRMDSPKQHILLTDPNGRIISELIATALSQIFYADKPPVESTSYALPSLQSESGSMIVPFEGEKCFVSFARAKDAGWAVFNILPYSSALAGIQNLVILTLSLTLFTFLVGYMLSKRLSSSLYHPIRKLYENYVDSESQNRNSDELQLLSDVFLEIYSKTDRLEQGLIASYQASKNNYLQYILLGEEEKVLAAYDVYDSLGIDLSAPFYCVILLECVPDSEYLKDAQEGKLFINYYALENISKELMAPARHSEFLRIGSNRFALLLSLDTSDMPERLHSGLAKIVHTMQHEFHITTTVCIGNTVNSWQNVNITYEQSKIAMNAHTPRQHGCVFLAGENHESINNEQYYNKIHYRLTEYVRNGDMSSCPLEFDSALSAMQNVSFHSAKIYFRHVLMSVLDDFALLFEKDADAFIALTGYFAKFDACQNVEDMRTVFCLFFNDLHREFLQKHKDNNQTLILNIKDYIDQHYSDPDISLGMLAERVAFSPAYLGKIFSSCTGFSFNDYLSRVRVTSAAEMLQKTNLPVNKISEQVGINNTNYFYSLFKKHYGVTPSIYRKKFRSDTIK